MDLFNRSELRRLAEQEDEVCISVYMPTFRVESDWSQNPTRFKNLLRDARDQLREKDVREERIDEILADVRQKLDRPGFWRNMSGGLAAFVTPGTTEFYRLPLSFEEVSIVDDRFHLKPLFPLIAANNRFYILALGRSGIRLYQGTHDTIGQVWTSEVPGPVVRALRAQNGVAETTEVQDAQDESPSTDAPVASSEDLYSFLHDIDSEVKSVAEGEEAPIVLAGEPSYRKAYEEVSDSDRLLEDHISWGHPEPPSVDDLHEMGWDIVSPVFAAAHEEESNRFDQLYYQRGELASDNFHEIIPACAYGRVDTLFVPVSEHRWGRFDPDTNTVEVHETRQPDDGDLLDYAAVRAYLNGSTVHVLQPGDMPGGRSIAATFRYQADVKAQEGS